MSYYGNDIVYLSKAMNNIVIKVWFLLVVNLIYIYLLGKR